MNILPKKRWHVRTRENIARVRRDEAKAAEEEKIRQARSQKAETEARIQFLRQQRRKQYDGSDLDKESRNVAITENYNITKNEHVNFFKELEDGKIDHHRPNDEHEAEIKAETEKYEKQIGYLTYLGQNTNESTGAKSWYEVLPRRLKDSEPQKEIQVEEKIIDDPICDIRRCLSLMGSSTSKTVSKTSIAINKTLLTTGKKRKHVSSSDSDSNKLSKKRKKNKKKSIRHERDRRDDVDDDKYNSIESNNVIVDKLRAERLAREQKEKMRTKALLAKLSGGPIPIAIKETDPVVTSVRQKYNSQFCPEIARQNIEVLSSRR